MDATNSNSLAEDAGDRRQSLEQLLAQCRSANWPGREELIQQIERELARLVQTNDDPPEGEDEVRQMTS